MSSIDRGKDYPVLSSDWTGLSRHLIASFYPVERIESADKSSFFWRRIANSTEVRTPLTDGSIDTTINWHSPFENTGIDQKFSSLSSMLQSGGFAPLIQAIKNLLPKGIADSLNIDAAQERLRNFEGRSSVTKLNATQIFSGLPPTKVNITAHFRAISDPDAEVRMPMDQLMRWALPQKLASDGLIANAAAGNLDAFPSKTPQIIAMEYADMLFMPMVIESAPYPLTGPRDKKGRMLSGQMALSIASLTSLDANDWVTVLAQGRARSF